MPAAASFVPALAALTVTLAVVVAPSLVPPAVALEPGVQLDIHEFVLRITNERGEITHVLEGDRMQQFDKLGLQRAENPRLELLTDGHIDWVWTAPAAVHYPAAHRLVLLGATEGLRLPSPVHLQTEITTTDVTIATDTREVLTDARATLVRPGLFMTGVGFHADVQSETIELRSEVETVYAPENIPETPP